MGWGWPWEILGAEYCVDDTLFCFIRADFLLFKSMKHHFVFCILPKANGKMQLAFLTAKANSSPS
jgi:hypothetical protein